MVADGQDPLLQHDRLQRLAAGESPGGQVDDLPRDDEPRHDAAHCVSDLGMHLARRGPGVTLAHQALYNSRLHHHWSRSGCRRSACNTGHRQRRKLLGAKHLGHPSEELGRQGREGRRRLLPIRPLPLLLLLLLLLFPLPLLLLLLRLLLLLLLLLPLLLLLLLL